MMPETLRYLLVVVVGYLLGNFTTGLFVSKLQAGIDIRKFGSGNVGATNILRVMGRQSALFTILGDILKGILACGVGALLVGFHGAIVGGTAAIIGHDWPAFFGFKGGKGVATSFGVLMLFFYVEGLVALLAFLIVLFITRYVSLSSLVATLVGGGWVCVSKWEDTLTCVCVALWVAMIFIRHWENIKRLFAGKENRLDFSQFKSRKGTTQQ